MIDSEVVPLFLSLAHNGSCETFLWIRKLKLLLLSRTQAFKSFFPLKYKSELSHGLASLPPFPSIQPNSTVVAISKMSLVSKIDDIEGYKWKPFCSCSGDMANSVEAKWKKTNSRMLRYNLSKQFCSYCSTLIRNITFVNTSVTY